LTVAVREVEAAGLSRHDRSDRRRWVRLAGALTAPNGRMIDRRLSRAFGTSNLSGGLGNLRHQLSPLEAPTSEFRPAASDSSHPAAFYLGG
jgi:hypothetical protein